MSALSQAAHRWVGRREAVGDATVRIVTAGIAASRRTAVAHHVADAAEITVGDETTLAAVWVCGGSSVDATLLPDDSVDCIGCRLAAAMPQGPCVYYAWGEDGELLYIGSTINPSQRMRGHMTQTRWWPEVRRLTFDEHRTERAARVAESEAIASGPGKYNREGVRWPAKLSPLLDLVSGDDA